MSISDCATMIWQHSLSFYLTTVVFFRRQVFLCLLKANFAIISILNFELSNQLITIE